MSNNRFKKTWRMPFWLGMLTLFGLLAALLGTGLWHGLAWLAMAIPLAIIIYYVGRGQRNTT